MMRKSKTKYAYDIYLQPQVRLDSGRLTGAEALIRKAGSAGELVPAIEMIPQTEQRHEIAAIDFSVMARVCRLMKKWQDWGIFNLHLAVNFSRDTLNMPKAAERIIGMCRKSLLSPESIVLEVTEQCMQTEENKGSFPACAGELLEAGFSLSLDDYGRGLSNMKILSEIEFRELKIDRSLLEDLAKNKRSRIIVRTIVGMCKELGNVRCIAEGIETESQVRILRELGCEYGQGGYYYRPMTIEDFENYFLVPEAVCV